MKTYTIHRAVTLISGLLKLTPGQVKSRTHNLKAKDKGLFEIVNPVCFKAGEVIGYDGLLSKDTAEIKEIIKPEKQTLKLDKDV